MTLFYNSFNGHKMHNKKVGKFNNFLVINFCGTDPLDIEHRLTEHKKFRRSPGRFLNVFRVFSRIF